MKVVVIPKRRCVLDRILVGIYTTFLPPPPKTTFGEPVPLGWVFEVVPEESPVWNCVGNASPEHSVSERRRRSVVTLGFDPETKRTRAQCPASENQCSDSKTEVCTRQEFSSVYIQQKYI